MNDQRISVLIVEDERIVASDLQQMLADMGYDAFAIASSADDALARASERVPDVVLMDIRIEGQRDGIETATLLRQRYGVPVIFLTAHADDATIERAKQSEPHGYLIKPVKAAEVRSAIEVTVFKHSMEKRLRARERWFATTLRSINDAVITVDLDGRINFMNATAEALTGVKAADAIGQRARDVLRLTDGAGPSSETPLDRALRERTPVRSSDAEFGAAADASTMRVISDSAAPVIENEELLGAVMVFRDIGEETRRDLTERVASLGRLASGIAHEINNPLAVVTGNASFVMDELQKCLRASLAQQVPPGLQIEHSLEDMIQAQSDLKAAAARIAAIVAGLSSFSQPAIPASAGTDVRRAIQSAIRATAHEFHDRARVEAVLGETPRAKLDEAKLGHVLTNLLTNAAHAIPVGNTNENRVTVTSATDPQGRVSIEVRDTGVGMSANTLKHMFDPFFTTKDVGAGAGLGLSICHGIVSAAGGEIRAVSAPGHGSTFRVTIPRAAAAGAPHGDPSGHQRRARILVVDDDDMVLRVTRRILRDHDVVCTESAASALELIDAGGQFDVIVSDVMMPVMTGVDFYEALLQRDPDLARRVIFVTGGALGGRTRDFLETVPNMRINKPFNIEDLQQGIQRQLASG